MSMNDDEFASFLWALENTGLAWAVDDLRARDNAQREALAHAISGRSDAQEELVRALSAHDEAKAELARVEASAATLAAAGRAAYAERDAALFQLTEVLRILDQHRAWTGMGWEQLPVPVHAVEKIRRKVAQAEQQVAVPRLVSYSEEMATCTLNYKGREYYFTLDGRSDEEAQGALTCEAQRAICGNCGGSGEVHRPDGEWLGTCTCPAGQEAQGAQAVDERDRFLTDEAYWVSQVLQDIGGMEPSWVEEDEVELNLEDDHGNSHNCTVSITEFSRRAAALIRELQTRAALATQPAEQLWAVHAQGPDDLYAAFSREEADAHAEALNALPCPPGISVSAIVIKSPWPAAEHWKYLVEQDREHHNAAVRGAEHE